MNQAEAFNRVPHVYVGDTLIGFWAATSYHEFEFRDKLTRIRIGSSGWYDGPTVDLVHGVRSHRISAIELHSIKKMDRYELVRLFRIPFYAQPLDDVMGQYVIYNWKTLVVDPSVVQDVFDDLNFIPYVPDDENQEWIACEANYAPGYEDPYSLKRAVMARLDKEEIVKAKDYIRGHELTSVFVDESAEIIGAAKSLGDFLDKAMKKKVLEKLCDGSYMKDKSISAPFKNPCAEIELPKSYKDTKHHDEKLVGIDWDKIA